MENNNQNIKMNFFFFVECCEIVVAINDQERDSVLPPKAVLQPAIFQAARKNEGGRLENFPPTA